MMGDDAGQHTFSTGGITAGVTADGAELFTLRDKAEQSICGRRHRYGRVTRPCCFR